MALENLTRRLQQNYLSAPDQTIVRLLYSRQPDQVLTYRDLLQGSLGYAQALQSAGILPGEVVVLILQHGPALVHAFFGAILYGAIPSILPFLTEKLSPEQYRRSLSALFQVTAPAAVITYPEFEAEVRQAALDAQKDAPASVRAILRHADIQPANAVDFSALPGMARQPSEHVLLQHSSGTTGLQKGVALSHQAVFNQLDSYSSCLHLAPEDVIVSWLPLYHDMGLIAGFLLPILQRVPLILMSPLDWVRAPSRLFQAVSHYRGTLTWMPNFAYNFCAQKVRERDLAGVDLSSWRLVINCSEPMLLKSHQIFLDRFQPYGLKPGALATCYAMAENVFAVSQGGTAESVTIDWIDPRVYIQARQALPALPGDQNLAMVSAGTPIENTRVCIFDDQKRKLPERQIGEIAIKSNCILSEYYHRPDATAKAFHNGWYLTGDLGYQARGELYITGRKKDLIIVGGKNIYPQDLESLCNSIAGIHPGRVVAFGVFNEDAGTEDVVIVAEAEDETWLVPEQGEALANEIRLRINRGSDIALRYVKIAPRGWLLKTSSGKVARSANRDKYLAELKSP